MKITNHRSKPILFDIKKCVLKDNPSGGEYVALTGDENAERLLYKTGRDIKINNGLIKAREILLEYQVVDNEIGPGQSVEGYVPFRMIASRATKVDLIISLDRAPDTAIGRYQETTFVLPFEHDLAVRHAQPAALSF